MSIPQTDARSGRARRLYGSLLCAVCSKADPGERAARREAVEAEMTNDAREQDPVAAFAPLGKAPAVAAPHSAAPPRVETPAERSNAGFIALVVAVFGAFLVAGVFVTQELTKDQPPPAKDWSVEMSSLEKRVQSLNDDLSRSRTENERLRDELRRAAEDASKGVETRLASRFGDLNTRLEGLATDSQSSSRQLAEKVARQEGVIENLSEQVRVLTATLNNGRSGGGNDGGGDVDDGGSVERVPPDTGPAIDPGMGDQPVRPADPKVLQFCNELIDEKQDDSVRFPAATELGRLNDPTAIPYLAKALITDSHFLVRRACARSLGNLKAWYAIPHLITALQDKEAYVAQQASYALQTICGQDFGVTQDQALGERKRRARDAGKWWEKNEGSPPEGVSLQKAEL